MIWSKLFIGRPLANDCLGPPITAPALIPTL